MLSPFIISLPTVFWLIKDGLYKDDPVEIDLSILGSLLTLFRFGDVVSVSFASNKTVSALGSH